MATPELVEMTMQALAALKEDLDRLRSEAQHNVNRLRTETQQNFDRLNTRLDDIRDTLDGAG